MQSNKLFSPFEFDFLERPNRMVMAPMNRCRAISNLPNALMVKYYERRANHEALSSHLNADLFYTADENGHTDYSVFEPKQQAVN